MPHTTTLTAPPADAPPPTTTDPPQKLAGILLGLLAILTVMLLAFAAPALNSGPQNLPLAVSGPEPGVSQIAATLEEQSPGAFEVTAYADSDEAAEAILDRAAVGGIAVDGNAITIQLASGAGPAYAQLLQGVGSGLEQAGQEVHYQDLAPTSADDATTIGVSTLGLPLIFGGMATAALLLVAYRGPVGMRLLGASTLALLGGFVAAAVLQFGFGAFDGAYWQISLVISAGILAIASFVLGLGTLLGRSGIALGALLMLLVANPLSGLANGPDWLPQPWGDTGQFLPLGAAGSLIRSVAYFDGGGAIAPALTLAAWILAGVLLAGLGAARAGRP